MTREISIVKNAPHKGCSSTSCCSPAKLWRSLQAFIKANDEKGLIEFFKDARQEHIVRVALTSRITNDAAMFPPSQQHKLIRLEERKLEANKYLGKSFNDLNSLQLALMTSSESMVLTLLAQLKLHATRQELNSYLSHIWGQGNTSLHLAVFLKRHAVVKTLIDLGCQPDKHLNARKKTAIDCCYYSDQRMIHLLSLHKHPETTTVQVKPTSTTTTVPMTTTTLDATKQERSDDNLTTELHAQLPVEMIKEEEEPTAVEELTISQCHPLLEQEHEPPPNNKDNIRLKKYQPSLVTHSHCRSVLHSQQEQVFVRLAQLKKPPDIHSCHLQPYDILSPLSMVAISC